MLNIDAYGARGDGNTANAALNDSCIARAVDDARAAGRGRIKVGTGRYCVSVAANVPYNNITFEGEGRESSVLVATQPGQNIIQFGDGLNTKMLCGVKNLGFDATVEKTGGAAVLFNRVNGSVVEDCYSNGQFEFYRQYDSALAHIRNCIVDNPTPGVGRGFYFSGGNDQYLTDCFVGGSPWAEPRCGYEIESTGAIWMKTCGALNAGIGTIAMPGPGKMITWMFTQSCAMDNCNSHGWLFQATAPGSSIWGWESSQDWAGTNGGCGVITVGNVVGLDLQAFRSINNGQHGVAVLGGTSTRLLNSRVQSNSQQSLGAFDGIHIGPDVSRVQVALTQSGSLFSDTHRASFYADAGCGDHFKVTDNDFSTAGITVFNGASGQNMVFDRNG